MTTPEVLAEGYIVVIDTDVYREQMAFAPDLDAPDPLAAYASFFHLSAQAATDSLEDDQESTLPAQIMSDGSIVTEYWTRTAAQIYAPYYVNETPRFLKTAPPTP